MNYLLIIINSSKMIWKFVNGYNVTNIQGIKDKYFNEELYGLSKILFTSINNNSKLALCHIKLQEYTKSVIEATKANNVFTWKFIWFDYLSASEFCLIASCGLEVIKYLGHVEKIVIFYSDLVHFTHLVSLFEQGLGSEDEHHRKKYL